MQHRKFDITPPEVKFTQDDCRRLQGTYDLLKTAFNEGRHHWTTLELLLSEATASSAIENEHAPTKVNLHHQGLITFLAQPLTHQSLLSLHHHLLNGQHHAQPGQYRSIDVVVGEHTPPSHHRVPSLMENFFQSLQTDDLHPIPKAAWAHMAFEIIHPFADGNGRTGRAIINHILDSPVPVSRFILANRREYYRLLAAESWQDFLYWLTTGLKLEAQAHNTRKAPIHKIKTS